MELIPLFLKMKPTGYYCFVYFRSIPADQRDDNDQATHKWMVYVRGPKESPNINGFVKKVWFFLHPSYRPNDLVEVRYT